MTKIDDDIKPSAAPSAEEIRRWNALPRDQQLARYRALFEAAESKTPGQRSMNEIHQAALARIAKRQDG